jgi:holo-[acyl-carrier protein] synthase
MIKGVGIDIIEIDRIKSAVDRFGDNFLNRVYTPSEIAYCKKRREIGIPELAVRFSAKEAYSKALGVGISGFARNDHGVGWKDIEIVNDKLGKPSVSFKGKVQNNTHISLSHSREYAVATVYVEE